MELLNYNEQLLINGGNEATYNAGHEHGAAVREFIEDACEWVEDLYYRVKNYLEILF